MRPLSSILDPRSSIFDPRSSILDPRSSILDLACLLQLFRLVLLLEALQVIDKARRRAFRYLFQIALQQRLALLFDVAADFAAEVPDHPELFGRHQVAQRLGSRVARDAGRYPVVLFGDDGLAAVTATISPICVRLRTACDQSGATRSRMSATVCHSMYSTQWVFP